MRSLRSFLGAAALSSSLVATFNPSVTMAEDSTKTQVGNIIEPGNILGKPFIYRADNGIFIELDNGKKIVRLKGANPKTFNCDQDSYGTRGFCFDDKHLWNNSFTPIDGKVDKKTLKLITGLCNNNLLGYQDKNGFYGLSGTKLSGPIIPSNNCI